MRTSTTRTARTLNQAAPFRPLPDGVTDLDHFRVRRRDRAGGVLHEYHLVASVFGTHNPNLLRLLARLALSFRPPTGFLRDFVVEHSGERKGQLDIKHGGLIPIVDLARWAGMAAGLASAPTLERLRAAEAAGTMESAEAQTLTEAFGFIFSLRLDHQVEQLRRGSVPDDFIDPKTLNPLARSYLREAFRAVASVQANLSAELSLGVRWG